MRLRSRVIVSLASLVVVLSSGRRRAHVNQIGVLAERAVAEAIVTGVEEADGLGVLPAARDLKR